MRNEAKTQPVDCVKLKRSQDAGYTSEIQSHFMSNLQALVSLIGES